MRHAQNTLDITRTRAGSRDILHARTKSRDFGNQFFFGNRNATRGEHVTFDLTFQNQTFLKGTGSCRGTNMLCTRAFGHVTCT